MYLKKFLLISSIILIASTILSAKQKVILFAIDGMRADILSQLKLSFFEKMNSSGIGTYKTFNNDISISGPSWTSVITGLRHEKHHVLNNQFNIHAPFILPSIPQIGRSIDPNLKFGMFMEWDKFYQFNKNIPWDTLIKGDFGKTNASTETIIKWIENSSLDFYFIYLGEPDYWGHIFGFEYYNPFYINSFKKINNSIERIINSINSRSEICNEEWLILTTTDHGGKGRHHSGSSIQEKQIFWFASFLTNMKNIITTSFPQVKITSAYQGVINNFFQPSHTDICITAINYLCPYNTNAFISDNCYPTDGVSWIKLLHTNLTSENSTGALIKKY